MLLPRRNKMLLDNRPRARNPASRRLPRNSRKIRQTLAGERDPATAVPEARAPAKLVQNHLEPGTARLDRRQLPTHLRLRPRDQCRALRRRRKQLASHANGGTLNLKEVPQVVRGEIEH